MDYVEIPKSSVTWTTTIHWAKDEKASYVGDNHGQLYKLVGGKLERLTKTRFNSALIVEIISTDPKLLVRQSHRQYCELVDGELVSKAESGAVVSNVIDGKVEVWDRSRGKERHFHDVCLTQSLRFAACYPRGFEVIDREGDKVLFSDKECWVPRLRWTPQGVLWTEGGVKVDDPDEKIVALFDPETGEKKSVPEDAIFLGVAGDYIVLKDGLHAKDWKKVHAFEEPPVAWAANATHVVWAVPEMEEVWGFFNPKTHVISRLCVADGKVETVIIPNTVVQGVKAMAFCGPRLLVGGDKLVWVDLAKL